MTCDGVFGINSHVHGIRLCSDKPRDSQRVTRLHQHFRHVHHLTPLASLAIARAISLGQDPLTTRLFDEHEIILNIDQLRSVNCPINKSFVHYPFLQITKCPCNTIKQIRHLKYHLQHVHRFTSQAASLIIKYVKSDTSIDEIQFPQHMDILQNTHLQI